MNKRWKIFFTIAISFLTGIAFMSVTTAMIDGENSTGTFIQGYHSFLSDILRQGVVTCSPYISFEFRDVDFRENHKSITVTMEELCDIMFKDHPEYKETFK